MAQYNEFDQQMRQMPDQMARDHEYARQQAHARARQYASSQMQGLASQNPYVSQLGQLSGIYGRPEEEDNIVLLLLP